jgi:23S rRNA pseudouridine1911/1915/1917 synthase
LIINKPAGMLSQGDKTGDDSVRDILIAYLKERDKKPGRVFIQPVHRLDRPVSGCLVLSKTSKALPRMMKLFADQKVEKKYIAISSVKEVQWDFDEKLVQSYIVKDRSRNKVRSSETEMEGGKLSQTKLKWLKQDGTYHVFECRPLSGRSHQIRIHMKYIGAPIFGDKKYGGTATTDKRLYLHCQELTFVHPVKNEKLTVTAPIPSGKIWSIVPDKI